MRTTVDFDDDLLRRLKRLAADTGGTLQGVVNDLLRKALAKPPGEKPYKFELQGWKGTIQPGVTDEDIASRSRLYDLLDDAEEMKRRGLL